MTSKLVNQSVFRLPLPHSSKINIVYLNTSAPCLVASQHFQDSTALTQHVTAEDMNNVGLLLLPVFSHKKGGRYMEEMAVMKSVQSTGLVTDHVFSLVFQERSVLASDVQSSGLFIVSLSLIDVNVGSGLSCRIYKML